jgi:hypothetical protein
MKAAWGSEHSKVWLSRRNFQYLKKIRQIRSKYLWNGKWVSIQGITSQSSNLFQVASGIASFIQTLQTETQSSTFLTASICGGTAVLIHPAWRRTLLSISSNFDAGSNLGDETDLQFMQEQWLNQATSTESIIFNSWQDRHWFKCDRRKWSAIRKAALTRDFNRDRSHDECNISIFKCFRFDSFQFKLIFNHNWFDGWIFRSTFSR